jgi:ketosteroid isomerase-like protein
LRRLDSATGRVHAAGVNICDTESPGGLERKGKALMRRLVIGSGIGFLLLGMILAACGASGAVSGADQNQQRLADRYEIDQIEKKFHHATTTKDIGLMMTLYAPNATMTVGPGVTASGLDEIRQFWLEKASTFEPQNHWLSDHPAYKLEITVNGDRGTLHFECHYIDIETGEVVYATTADFDVARIDGKWLITNMVGGTTVLEV